MSGKREQKFETPDRMIDSHREFLDMDTDEEDFGRQESPEVEEELPLEPEKPIFSEEELIKLVKYVKDLTVHTNCDNVNWNQHSDEIIREYFTDPSHTVLSIFCEQAELNAILNIPTHASSGFTYFVRSPWQVYTPDNFRITVSFGTVNRDVKNTVLKFMENVYAPIVLHSDEYASCIQIHRKYIRPLVTKIYYKLLLMLRLKISNANCSLIIWPWYLLIKNNVFVNLHTFIVHLMEEIYKPMGLTMLYVPKERLLQTFSTSWNKNDYFLLGGNQTTIFSGEDERKRKLIDRLEKIVWFWIKQIREATRTASTRENIKNIQDEVKYWTAKHSNLNYLRNQILNPEVRLILDILENLNSISISKMKKLIADIDAGLKETSSNLMYLNILRDSCKNIKVTEDVENSMTDAVLLILFIWSDSPFYSATSNITILYQALSSQIMYQCKEYIKLDVLFGNNPEQGIKMLRKCILCCNIYKTIYDNLTVNIISSINPDRKWDTNRQAILYKIDTFKQRCYDVIEICQALIIFGRNDKTGLIGGPRGVDYEAYWRHIETLFFESLNEITMHQDIIFDVSKFVWCKKMKQFKYTVSQLENMVVNLINDIFENVKNIEEGVEAIYALRTFQQRENLQEILRNKWIKVWQMFDNEIKCCYTRAIVESKERTDINESLTCISEYLKYQHSIMMKASDWIGECSAEKCTLQQYEYVLDVIDKRKNMCNVSNTNGIEFGYYIGN